MKFKHYKEWKIPEAATKAAPGNVSGVYFYMVINGISAAAGSLLSGNMQASRVGH